MGIGLELQHFGLQRDCFEQPIEIELLLGGDFDFEASRRQVLSTCTPC